MVGYGWRWLETNIKLKNTSNLYRYIYLCFVRERKWEESKVKNGLWLVGGICGRNKNKSTAQTEMMRERENYTSPTFLYGFYSLSSFVSLRVVVVFSNTRARSAYNNNIKMQCYDDGDGDDGGHHQRRGSRCVYKNIIITEHNHKTLQHRFLHACRGWVSCECVFPPVIYVILRHFSIRV